MIVRKYALWLLASGIVAMASPAFAEYRYALILDGKNDGSAKPAIAAMQQHGFQCTVGKWKTEREVRNGVADFMTKTATNSTALILYCGTVSIVESKSKEHRGQKSLGVHLAGDGAIPVIDLAHTMNTRGGSVRNIIYLDTAKTVSDPQSKYPRGVTVISGSASGLASALKESGAPAALLSTAISPPGRFKTGGKPGDEWVNAHGMVFRWCPAGSFAESLKQQVVIDEGFWLMKYEWTRGQIMGKGDLRRSPGSHKLHALGNFGFRELPGMLKRFNAEERKAGRLPADYEYALPSEVQWEYAARAGSASNYCFGDDESQLVSYGNFADKSYYDTGSVYSNYGHRTLDDGQPDIAMVGSYKPNAWGFFDMHGNVGEYCENGACRGGSWLSTASSCRFSFRDHRWGHGVGEYQGYRFVIRKVASGDSVKNAK